MQLHILIVRISFLLYLVNLAYWVIGQPNQMSDKQLLRRGKELMKEGNPRGANPLLSQAIVTLKEDLEANYWYGKCLYLIGNRAKAKSYLEKVYQQKPSFDPDLGLMYASSLHANLQFDQAIALLKSLKAKYPVTAKEQFQIAQIISQSEYGKYLVKKPVDVKIENVGNGINTPFPEYAPVINADESIMLFTSRRPENLGGKRPEDNDYYEDVYTSYQVNGVWDKAINLGSPINTNNQDAPIAVSADGQTLFIHRDDNGGDIFVSYLIGDQWSDPQNLGKPVNTEHWEPSVCLSADGNRLFYVSNKPGGYGHRDIYVSHKLPDNKWSPGKNLGNTINTFGHEESPYLHPDGKTLYFSSNGHKTMGGFDIFKTILQDDGSWSAPVNIGYPINTPEDDIYFVMSANGKHGYYASDGMKDSYGQRDIYRIVFPDITPVSKQEFEPVSSVTLLKGVIIDAKTKKPLEASIFIVDNEANDTISIVNSNKATGKYLVTLTPGKNYGIVAYAKGYLYCSDNVEIASSTKQFQEFVKDIELFPIEAGRKVILKNIFFDFDKSTLRPTSKAELSRLVQLLNQNPSMRIAINGHTDNKGSDEYNLKLSESRAKAVVDYLIDRKIPESRLRYKGYGESMPIDTNETAEGRQNNRRTEFEIIQQ